MLTWAARWLVQSAKVLAAKCADLSLISGTKDPRDLWWKERRDFCKFSYYDVAMFYHVAMAYMTIHMNGWIDGMDGWMSG